MSRKSVKVKIQWNVFETAHLQCMRLAPTNQKDSLTLKKASNITYFSSNCNYHDNMYF